MRARLETLAYLLIVVTCFCGVQGQEQSQLTLYSSTGLTFGTVNTTIVTAANTRSDGPKSTDTTLTSYNISHAITTSTNIMTTSSSTTTAIPAIAVTSTIISAATTTASIHTYVITSSFNATVTPNNSESQNESSTENINGNNAGAIAGGVIGVILAVVITAVIIFISIYYWYFIYKRRNDETDNNSGGSDGKGDNNDDDVAEMCFHNPFSRLELPNVFSQVYAYLNCNDNTVILSVTNAAPDSLDKFDITVNSQKYSNVEIPHIVGSGGVDDKDLEFETPYKMSDLVDNSDFVSQPFCKTNTQQRYMASKPPDKPAPMPHTLPRLPEKGIVSKPFGVHPYAVVNLEKLIGQTTEGAKRYPLELPPKPTQKTSAPSQTATADSVQHEPSNELRKHDNPPHQTLPNTLLSASHGNDDTSGINKEKKFTYADLQQLPVSDKFIVTDDACVNYAEIK